MKDFFITVEEAQKIITRNAPKCPITEISIEHSSGLVLAHDVRSPVKSPPFHQSAMDGYAFRWKDAVSGKPLKTAGESSTRKAYTQKLRPMQAIRIFTGARLPSGADTVVMQEKVRSSSGSLLFDLPFPVKGANIRTAGSAAGKNELVARTGSMVTPGSIGLFASLGIRKVRVFSPPGVCVIITGDELKKAGSELDIHEVFESNSYTLQALLAESGIDTIKKIHVRDNINALQKVLNKAFINYDLVLITGGISTGDYDYTGLVLKNADVKTLFYKVQQKPGKPLFFGRKGKKPVFGLPGNPAAVMTCYYEYVYPLIRTMMGFEQPFLPALQLPLTSAFEKKAGLTHFLKAETDFSTVTLLEGQESYKMNAFHSANCLVKIPGHIKSLKTGSKVEVHIFGKL